jgi:hypothetical protein
MRYTHRVIEKVWAWDELAGTRVPQIRSTYYTSKESAEHAQAEIMASGNFFVSVLPVLSRLCGMDSPQSNESQKRI